MKKYIKLFILGFALCGISNTGFSQFTFGPKIGVNFSNYVEKTNMRGGIDAGIFFRVGTAFYFQPEVVYSFRSSTLKEIIKEIGDIGKFKNHYFDIPLLLGYKFINNDDFKFRVFLGPRLGLLMTNNSKEKNPMGVIQIGGRTGLGIDFWRFTFDVNYDFSTNQPNSDASSTWWKQHMFNISLGFKVFKD